MRREIFLAKHIYGKAVSTEVGRFNFWPTSKKFQIESKIQFEVSIYESRVSFHEQDLKSGRQTYSHVKGIETNLFEWQQGTHISMVFYHRANKGEE